VRVVASPELTEFVAARGGVLYVDARHHGCCNGGVTLLEATTEAPEGQRSDDEPAEEQLAGRRVVAADGFLLVLGPRLRADPDELVLELKGRRHPRPRAFWNGCAYVI
jgi:hypothetical protein